MYNCCVVVSANERVSLPLDCFEIVSFLKKISYQENFVPESHKRTQRTEDREESGDGRCAGRLSCMRRSQNIKQYRCRFPLESGPSIPNVHFMLRTSIPSCFAPPSPVTATSSNSSMRTPRLHRENDAPHSISQRTAERLPLHQMVASSGH